MKRMICILTVVMIMPALTAVQAQEFALEQLEASPRHHEWVAVEAGDRTVHSFVAYPETNEPVPAVVVIHENQGLTDWVRSFADQLAAAGYIAVAPDLLSEADADHERTSAFPSTDAAREALYELDPDQITSDLEAVRAYASGISASNGTTVVMGFCWGGAQTFRFATNSPDIAAALPFYGSPPESGYENITVPVYGFYGENDERINATIPDTEAIMAQHGKSYEAVIYDGAGHGYMRSGDDPEGSAANRAARDASWVRLNDILSGL